MDVAERPEKLALEYGWCRLEACARMWVLCRLEACAPVWVPGGSLRLSMDGAGWGPVLGCGPCAGWKPALPCGWRVEACARVWMVQARGLCSDVGPVQAGSLRFRVGAGWKPALRGPARQGHDCPQEPVRPAAHRGMVGPCEFLEPAAWTDGGFACRLLLGRRFFEHLSPKHGTLARTAEVTESRVRRGASP
jgi:hypothetical protein